MKKKIYGGIFLFAILGIINNNHIANIRPVKAESEEKNYNIAPITILAHGLGGKAYDWSNNFSGFDFPSKGALSLCYDPNSLIEKIRTSLDSDHPENIKLYLIDDIQYKNETLPNGKYEINYCDDSIYNDGGIYDVNYKLSSSLTSFDYSKPIIIDLEYYATKDRTIPDVYSDFKNILDWIVKDYKKAKSTEPKLNLIGHSLGGLMNMYYSIDNPNRIEKLISIDTPYNGSSYDNDLVEFIGIKDFKEMPCLCGKCSHQFCDLNYRRSKWNETYEQYPNIEFYAISGDTSFNLVDKIINDGYVNKYNGAAAQAGAYSAWVFVLGNPQADTNNRESLVINGDFCVDVNSQQAPGYNGVSNYHKIYTTKNSNLNKCAENNYPVPHNLAPLDNDIHNCILEILNITNNQEKAISKNNISAKIISHINSEYQIKVTNNTNKSRIFIYSERMCSKNSAQMGKNFSYVNATINLTPGKSTIISIRSGELVGDKYFCIFYDEGKTRKIFYATDLNSEELTMVGYATNITINPYEKNYMGISVLGKADKKWIIELTNNSGIERKFEYNSKMCFESDAKNWNDLYDIKETAKIKNGEIAILIIEENYAATHIAISYTHSDNHRYVFYADEISKNSTLNAKGNILDERIKISLTGKSNGYWGVTIKNDTGAERDFYFNSKMCFESDAKNWDGLKDVSWINIGKGCSRSVNIKENGSATSIAICYIENDIRYICYANDLDPDDWSYDRYTSSKKIESYQEYGIKTQIIGKNSGTWLIQLTNNTGERKGFEYFPKMCNEAIAKGWNYLGSNNSSNPCYLNSGASSCIYISENGTKGYIAISYLSGNSRYIFYANGLSTSCTLNKNPYVRDETIKADIISKSGGTWNIKLTNNTGKIRTFYYNKKMCFECDGDDFTGLTDVGYVRVSNGSSTNISISENGTARFISLCYIEGNYKYILYAYSLGTDGGMISFRSTVYAQPKDLNGMKVIIAGKDSGTWLFELTNTSGSTQNFYYNSKLAFEGDASKWSGLSDIASPISLSNAATTTYPIRISENGFAGTMSISYVDSSNYRHVFYAYDLSTSGSMTAKSNTINLNQSSDDNCVVKGTMITLADGSKKAVEDLTGDEMLLVWNFETGTYDYAPILFVDSDPEAYYEVITLTFSDDTCVKVVTEHGFYDTTLNKYVYLDKNAAEYLGHNFIKSDGENYIEVTLTNVEITTELTSTYSPVTYSHLCYYVNDMLSMPGGINGLFNYFDIDGETMKYDAEAKARDIETYGLLTYEELYEIAPVSREMFDAVNGQYLKIAIGKGLISLEEIQYLADRYSSFVPEEIEEGTNELSLKEYVLTKLESYGYSLEDVINYYLQLCTGCSWFKVPSSVMSNLDWDVVFNGNYYIISISLNMYGTSLNIQVAIA